jgi:hypothetical protein
MTQGRQTRPANDTKDDSRVDRNLVLVVLTFDSRISKMLKSVQICLSNYALTIFRSSAANVRVKRDPFGTRVSLCTRWHIYSASRTAVCVAMYLLPELTQNIARAALLSGTDQGLLCSDKQLTVFASIVD